MKIDRVIATPAFGVIEPDACDARLKRELAALDTRRPAREHELSVDGFDVQEVRSDGEYTRV